MITKRHSRSLGIGALISAAALVAAAAGAASAAPPTTIASAVAAGQIANITAATQVDAHTVVFTAGSGKLRVTATTPTTLHVEFAQNGVFVDPNAAPSDPTKPDFSMIVDRNAAPTGTLTLATTSTGYDLSTAGAKLSVTKTAPKLTLRNAAGTVLFAEASPLSWSDAGTTQTLAPKAGEQFYGAGEQNGGYNHTGKTINVANSGDWSDGGYNNSQPYYVSTAGYGVFRNTWQPGVYNFSNGTGATTTTEDEQRFDAYYFVGDLKGVIGGYTSLVGKPFMPPIYGLEHGDADCYLHNANRGERHTLDALKVAQGYVDNGMPNGWMLVNDGYGCGYEDLAETGQGLRDRNMQLGLWTQDGLANQTAEVAAGVKVRKLDVAWVGGGYRFANDGCETAYNGIQAGGSRGYVWQPNSWAGAQRCAVLWSGDQTGSWDNIKWQIPTYAASSMSGIAYNTGDIDGIYGGSPKTYARELQWKTFLPTTMTMDGWAGTDKQPFVFDDSIDAINRKYLLLKERLLPYQYTYSAEAHRTGVGQTRPLYLEYPDDAVAKSDAAKYEFLSGRDFLVAPVYSDTSIRNGIYLPKGTWVDYWSGRTYEGPTTVDGYKAPLDTLPLFVRGGAIIPMWPEGTLSWKTRNKSQFDFDVYPQGNSSFDLYEDEGDTRAYENGASSTQTVTVKAPDAGRGNITVNIGKISGTYAGQAVRRAYNVALHSPVKPLTVRGNAVLLPEVADAAALKAAATGWYYDATTGIAHIKTKVIPRVGAYNIVVAGGSAITLKGNSNANAMVSFTAPEMVLPGTSTSIPVTFKNNTTQTVSNVSIKITSDNPGVSGAATPVGHDVAPGESATVNIPITVGANAEGGAAVLTATATYVAQTRTFTVVYSDQTNVPYPSLLAAANNNGVTDLASKDKSNWDGSAAFPAEQLAQQGYTPGAKVTVGGIEYTWPNVQPADNDNVVAGGETITMKGKGSQLGVLGGSSGIGAGGPLTVIYADGTTDEVTVKQTNWCCEAVAAGNVAAVSTNGRYIKDKDGLQNPDYTYTIFADAVAINPDKDVIAVTLPISSDMHVFALGLKTPAPTPPAGDSWMSDLTETSSDNGYGPFEKDRSNGEAGPADGHPITIGGVVHAKGLGTHAVSKISYYLGGKCTKFTATVGVDDEVNNAGSVHFKVVADGVNKYSSDLLTGASAPVAMSADVTGAQNIDLIVDDNGDGKGQDHGDWGSAKITCS